MRIDKYTMSVSLFLLYSFQLSGQGNVIDSLKRVLQTQKEDTNKVKTLNVLSTALTDSTEYDNALKYANEALALAEKLNFKPGQAKAYEVIAWIYQIKGDYVRARKNYLSASGIYEQLKDKVRIAVVCNHIANSHYTEGDFAEAIKNSYNALKIYEELKDKSGTAFTYLFLGSIYYFDKNYSESIKNIHSSLKLYEEMRDTAHIAYCKLGIGKINAIQGEFTEALNKYSEVLNVFEKVKDKRMIAETHRSFGELFESLGGKNKNASQNYYSDALKYYIKNLSFFEDIKDKGGIVTGYYLVGNINIKLGDLRTAKNYLEKALQVGNEIGSKGDLQDIYRSFSILDSSENNYKEAHEHYKMYILYRDSISNEETKKKLVRTTMQYEFDKKEAIATAEQERKDLQTKRTRNLQYTAIAAILLISIFLYWNTLQKQKAKTKIEKAYAELKATQQQLIQSEKMASLGELTAGIAHEIQNPLNFVNNFSEVNIELLAEMKSELDKGNTAEAKVIANDIIDNQQKINHHGTRAGSIVKGMLQHSRSSSGVKEPTDINALADEYLRLAYHGLRAKDKSFNATTKTDLDESIGKINIIPQDIGRAILNLITNAFYAVTEKKKQLGEGYEPIVSVSSKNLGDKVLISVKDNGDGIPQKVLDKIFQPFFTTKPTGQGTGLGLSLSYDIIKAHGGELKVETREGEYSEFIIQLPSSQT